jgi:hypothetical protein
MGTIVCPGREDLTQYLLGVMEGERADAIDVHLGVCPACIARARGLIAEDEFTQAIRAGRPAIEDDVDEWADLIMHGVLLQAEKSTFVGAQPPSLIGPAPPALAPPEADFRAPTSTTAIEGEKDPASRPASATPVEVAPPAPAPVRFGSAGHPLTWLVGATVAATIGLSAWWAGGADVKFEASAGDDVAASVAGK